MKFLMTENCLFGVGVYAAVATALPPSFAAVNEKILIIVSRVIKIADVYSKFNKQLSTNNNNFRRKILIGKKQTK